MQDRLEETDNALHQAWHTAHGNNGDDDHHHNDDSDDTSSWACAGCYTTQVTGTRLLNSIIETILYYPILQMKLKFSKIYAAER